MTDYNIAGREFQLSARSDDQNKNTYEGSEIDNYLENDWYNSLSSTMKSAIQTTSIKQASYAKENDPDSKQETGYNGQVYNTISRHVFLPSVSEIGKVVDLKNPEKVKEFFNNDFWTRDSYQGYNDAMMFLFARYGYVDRNYTTMPCGVRSAFVIDLSQVNYSVVK